MLGLMEKDFRLIFSRKSTIYIMLALAITLGLSTDGSFILGYLVCIGVLYASSTISFDEYDNGYSFLMTLPITRDIYVIEKYIFTISSGIISWIIGTILYFAKLYITHSPFILKEELAGVFAFLPVLLILTALMIPFPLKFGSEKGRLAMMITFGVVFAIGILGQKILTAFHIPFASIISILDSFSPIGIILVVISLTLLVLFISLQISRSIMQKKEF